MGSKSFRIGTFRAKSNDEGLKLHLDLLQKKRDQAQITMSAYQERVSRYFNKKVKPRSFRVEDLVLQKVILAIRESAEGKLAPNWEGPYRVINCQRPGVYYLEDRDGKVLQRPWNVEHLKKYFS